LIALAERKVEYQLCVSLDCDKAVVVSEARIMLGALGSLLAINPAPNFVEFHILARNVFDFFAQQLLAALASFHEQPEYRIAVNVGQSFDAANAHAFDQHLENHLGSRQGQTHFIKRALVSFREAFVALVATKPL